MAQSKRIEIDEASGKLIIQVDLSEVRLSKSGDSAILYSTPGFFEPIYGSDTHSMKLIVIRKLTKEEKESIKVGTDPFSGQPFVKPEKKVKDE